MQKTKRSIGLLLCILLCSFVITGGIVLVGNPVQIEAASKPKLNMNKTKAYITKGDSLQLSVSRAKGKVKWSSSPKSVARVSTKGKVTGIKKGTATVTALVGSKKYKCKVTVETPSISSKSISIDKNESINLRMRNTKQSVTWSSSDKNIATVSKKGLIYGKNTGTANIIAKVGTKKYSCRVNVNATAEVPQNEQTIGYMSDFSVQYNSNKESYEVLFAFRLKDGITRVSASGTAAIKIVNDNGVEVFNKSIPFTPQNFATWSSFNAGNRYLCCIQVPKADIQNGKSSTGVLTLGITLSDGDYFSDHTATVSELPRVPLEDLFKIDLPPLPREISKYNYNDRLMNRCLITKQNISWERSGDTKANAIISITGTKTYDYLGSNYSSNLVIPWKLYKDDVVVSSGNFYSTSVAVGETFVGVFYISNLQEGSYRLEY